jgi:hypothetical protein
MLWFVCVVVNVRKVCLFILMTRVASFPVVTRFTSCLIFNASCDSAVCIATCYGMEGRGSNPSGIESFRRHPYRLWYPHNFLCNGHQGSFPGVNRPRREVHYLLPSTVEVKYQWSYAYNPSIRLRGVNKDSFTLFYLTTAQWRSSGGEITASRSLWLGTTWLWAASLAYLPLYCRGKGPHAYWTER